MRVIAGVYRGRSLKAPRGLTTRPTTDRVKETLMNSLRSAYGPFEGARVLDAFAGTGALGIECLSRGARVVHFYERDTKAYECLRANLAMLRISSEAARVFKADILAHPPTGTTPYDLLLLDPPYAYYPHDMIALVRSLWGLGMLAVDAVISYEHDASQTVEDLLEEERPHLELLVSKKLGDTSLDLLTFARI